MNSGIVLILFVALNVFVRSQTKDQYSFAQSYLGFQETYLLNNSKGPGSPDYLSSRLTIGGFHFWQRAEFYVSFSIADVSLSKTKKSWKYSEGVITGARFIPFRPGKKFPKPYFGLQWITPSFKVGDGAERDEDALGIELGLMMWLNGNTTLEFNAHHRMWNRYAYYTDRLTQSNISAPSYGFSLAIKKHVDFTSNMRTESSQLFQKKQKDLANKNGGLNDWSFAVGPSAAINPVDVPYLKQFPFMNKRMGTSIIPDFGVGKYLAKPDMAVRMSYRPVFYRREAYGLKVRLNNHFLALESFKFLFDYHGFVPFLGLSAGLEYHDFSATDNDIEIGQSAGFNTSYGLVFGWDIRPSEVEWFILRTNLRYMTGHNETVNGKRILTGQFEFNFIQFVFYPQRKREYNQTQDL